MFDIPEGYKRTKVGFIPVEWEVTEISEICDVLLSGVDKKSDPGEKPVLLCNYLDVLNNEYISSNLQFMKATAKGSEIEKFTLQKNDVIITKDSETKEDIASSATVIEDLEGVLCGYHLAILRPFKPVDGIYLSKVLSSPNVHKQFVNATNGITRFGLTLPTINGVQVYHPPLPEQHQIAAILSTVDAAIAATDEVITKTEDLKRGLMQDLLTKGIDEEGRVRSEETHEFREQRIRSETFKFPKSWKFKNMGDIITLKRGYDLPSDKRVAGDVPVISSSGVCGYHHEATVCGPGVVTGRYGTLGEVFFIERDFWPLNTTLYVCNFKSNDPKFISYFLKFHLEAYQSDAVSIPGINRNFVHKIPCASPPLPEQYRIATILSTVDRDLAAERDHRARLLTLKKGLMQDLLTGRKRVPLDGGEAHGA